MALRRRVVLHEDVFRKEELRLSTNRQFGLVFAALFLIIAFAPLLRHHAWRPRAVPIAVVLFAISLTRPEVLQPLNKLWARVGVLLQTVTSSIVLGVMFFAVVTPLAMLMRWVRRDPLRLHWDREAKSYWLKRAGPGPPPQSIKDQF